MKAFFMIITTLLLTQLSFADKTHSVDTAKSKVEWLGTKVTGKHNGDIKFKSGKVVVDDNGVLKSAEFVVDMNTINTKDLEGEWKDKLDGHLKNEDFFNVAKYGTSTLKLKKVNSKKGNVFNVAADLTIMGKTNPVTFDVTLKDKTAKGSLTFNRTKWGIKYGSGSFFKGLGDKMIHDEIKLDFNVALK